MSAGKQAKAQFNQEITFLKRKIDEINQKIKYLESRSGVDENLVQIQVASHYVDLVSIYCAMTDLSQNLLGYRNESYLDLGRKSLYKAIIILEKCLSSTIDLPLSENYELLTSFEGEFGDHDRLKLVRKIGYTISLLEDRYGKSSKWRWSFVELEGRYAVLTKNLFNFRAYQEKNDPNLEGFDDRYDHLYLIKDLFSKVSKRYREKYELTNHSPDDMKKAINFLSALKRIHVLFKEHDEAQNYSKTLELWNLKLEADLKAKEKQLRANLVGQGKKKS